MKQRISLKLRERSVQALKDERYQDAVQLNKKILSLNANDIQALGNLAYAYDALGMYKEFYEVSQRGLNIAPKDNSLIQKMAVAEHKLGQHQQAYNRLKNSITTHGLLFETALNLCTVAGELGLDRENLNYALEAVRLKPGNAGAHVNLGAAFMTLLQFNEAQLCFETALIIEPNNVTALVNLGVIHSKKVEDEKAINYFEKAISLIDPRNQWEIERAKFFLGVSQLVLGNLTSGWTNYSSGFKVMTSNGRGPHRSFNCPEWREQDLKGKRLLIWREQGLGDEIFFFTSVKRLLTSGIVTDIIIECDVRLITILQRTFPTAIVRAASYDRKLPHLPIVNDFDYHIPAGNLFARYHQNHDSFDLDGPYLIADQMRIQKYENRLGPRNDSLRVGICWRSGNVTANRQKYYSAISDWENILKIKGIQFVNLQYGNTTAEVHSAESAFNVSLNSWPDIDRKDDLDELAALMSCLDLVISVGTATAQLAAAVGAPVWLLDSHVDWPHFGTKSYPVYRNVRCIFAEHQNGVPDLVRNVIPNMLQEYKGFVSDKFNVTSQMN